MVKFFKNIKRLKLKVASIIMLVVLLTLECSPLAVKAVKQELNYYSPGSIRVGYDTYNKRNVWFGNTTLGGIVSYCIDYSYHAPRGTMTYRGPLSDQGLAILIHGYPNATPESLGCQSNDEAYMATQMALWEVLNRTGESKKTHYPFRVENIDPANGYNAFLQRALAGAEKLKEIALANPYTDVPKLTITTSNAELKEFGDDEVLIGPYKAEVTGVADPGCINSVTAALEGAPASARITDAQGNDKPTMASGDLVYVRMNANEKTVSFNLRFAADVDKKVGAIYTTSDSNAQDYVILDVEPVSMNEFVTIKYDNDISKGAIEIVKVDQEDKPVKGAKFELQTKDGRSLGEGRTNSEGKLEILNVPVGDYVLVEVEAPNGYIIKNASTNVTVKAGETTSVKVVNEKTNELASFVMLKLDKENETALAGAVIRIYNSQMEQIHEVTTNAQGRIAIENISLGKYYYQEVKAPDGYVLDDTLHDFTLTEAGKVIGIKIYNEKAKGGLKIIKVDESKNPIAGVKFNILDSDKQFIETIVTDDKGVAVSSEMQPGTYYYQEIEAPNGYIVDSTEHQFTIEYDGQNVIENVVNYMEKGQLQITKYDSEENKLSDVTFDILDESGNVVDTITTDENGVALSKRLPVGTYYYVETSAPENVVMDTERHSFALTQNNQVVKKTVVNDLKEGYLKIIKVDENNEPLEGVKFEILDLNKKVIDTMVTNDKGIAESGELKKGTYYYREVEAPEGIVVDSSLHEFTIEYDGQNVVENVVNYYIKGQLKILKLVEGSNEVLAGVKFDVLDEDRNVVDTIVTDENGVAESKKLTYGKYYFKEVEAPEGYIMDDSEHEFTITNDGDLIEAIVYNQKEELPKTGGLISDNMIIVLVVSMISILGYGFMNLIAAKKED